MKSRVLVLGITMVIAVVLVLAWWVAAPVAEDDPDSTQSASSAVTPAAAIANAEPPTTSPADRSSPGPDVSHAPVAEASSESLAEAGPEQEVPPPRVPDGSRLLRVRDLWDAAPVPGLAYILGTETAPRAADRGGWIVLPADAPIAQIRAASDSWWLADAVDTTWFVEEETLWAGRVVTVTGRLVPAEGDEFSAQDLTHAQVGLVMTGHPDLTVIADGARTRHWWDDRERAGALPFEEMHEVGRDGTFRFRALAAPEWSVGNRGVPGRRREIAALPRPRRDQSELHVQLRLRPTRTFQLVVRKVGGELVEGARVGVQSSLRIPTSQSGSVRAARLGGGFGSIAGADETVFRYMSSAVTDADGVAVAAVEHDHPATIRVEFDECRVCTIDIAAGGDDIEREVVLKPTHDTPDVRLLLDGEPVAHAMIGVTHAGGSNAGLPVLRTDAYGYLDTGHFDEGARYQLRHFMRPDVEHLEFRWSGQEELHFRQKERSRPERRPR